MPTASIAQGILGCYPAKEASHAAVSGTEGGAEPCGWFDVCVGLPRSKEKDKPLPIPGETTH